jgi:hypothetical protein
MARGALVILLFAAILGSCENFEAVHQEKPLLEACLREAWTQGEQAGKFGIACAAMNDWARRQGWNAQPSGAVP